MKANQVFVGIIAVLIITIFFSSLSSWAEIIVLKSGQKIEGKVLKKTEDHIEIEIFGVPLKYSMDDIESMASSSVPEVLKQENPADSGTIPTAQVSQRKSMPVSDKGKFLFKKGVALAAEGKFKESQACFNEVMTFSKHNMFTFFFQKVIQDFYQGDITEEICLAIFKGENALLNNKTQDAMEYLKSAVRTNPDYIEANGALAWAYYSTGQYKDAVHYFIKAIQLDPQESNPNTLAAYYFSGSAFVSLGQYKDAKVNLQKAAKILRKIGLIADAQIIEVYVDKLPG